MKSMIIYLVMGLVSFQAPKSTVSVEITNVKAASGDIRIGLYDQSDTFMKKAYQFQKVPISRKGTCLVVFENIPSGEYAISLYHDKNGNGKLDSNFMKIPKEPYGFSNNVMGLFGPPSFEQASFEVEEKDVMVSIKL
ncbi:MAG: DUF2141 domain-containing protein [Bacteroidota bacterium]